jgi:hypothetical protein
LTVVTTVQFPSVKAIAAILDVDLLHGASDLLQFGEDTAELVRGRS